MGREDLAGLWTSTDGGGTVGKQSLGHHSFQSPEVAYPAVGVPLQFGGTDKIVRALLAIPQGITIVIW